MRKVERPMVNRASIFLTVEDPPKVFLKRRRRRGMRGICIGPAGERELEYIRENYLDVVKAAGL